jgi:hypothetical protein
MADNPLSTLNPEQKSGSHSLIWFGAALVVLVGAIAGGVVFFNNKPIPQLSISFVTPAQTLVGSPFTLTISYANNSNQTLQGASLAVLLPEGISSLANAKNQRVITEPIGDLPAGDTSSTVLNLIPTNNPNSVQHIQATVTYGAASNTTAQYATQTQTDIAIGPTALNFSFSLPQNVFSGENFPVIVSYNNQSSQNIADAHFTMSYPNGFNFISSSMPLLAGSNNNVWDLGAVPAGASSTFTITGNISGPTSALYALSGILSGTFQGQTYPITTQSTNVTIAQAPLTISLSLNGTSTYVSTAGDQLNYVLTYTNTSNLAFSSANVTVKLTGAMFDFSKLHTDGSFSSVANTITWNAAQDRTLASIEPGQSGSLNFQLSTKDAYPIHLPSDKNFVLKAIATIYSPTVPVNTAGGSGTQSVTELDNKVGGELAVAAKGYFHDPSGIVNIGPYPPKVNQATNYTVHWQLTNYATDVSNVTVSAYLQSGSSFTGTATTTIPSSTLNYDAGTGLVTWTIPSLSATTGVLGKPPEAIFQLSNTPAVNQLGQSVTLLGQTSVTATDNFTGKTLSGSDQPVTTQLPDDSTVASISSKIVSQ